MIIKSIQLSFGQAGNKTDIVSEKGLNGVKKQNIQPDSQFEGYDTCFQPKLSTEETNHSQTVYAIFHLLTREKLQIIL